MPRWGATYMSADYGERVEKTSGSSWQEAVGAVERCCQLAGRASREMPVAYMAAFLPLPFAEAQSWVDSSHGCKPSSAPTYLFDVWECLAPQV